MFLFYASFSKKETPFKEIRYFDLTLKSDETKTSFAGITNYPSQVECKIIKFGTMTTHLDFGQN